MIYGREALRQYREKEQAAEDRQAGQEPSDLLSQIPTDAPVDDATITAWDGERWRDLKWWTIERAFALAKITGALAVPEESIAAPIAASRPRRENDQEGLWE